MKLPFLLNLSPESRKKARKMGPKSVEYVNLKRDVKLVNVLLPVRIQLAALLEGIDDTMMAAGSDAMQTSDIVYSYLKTASRQNANVKALISDIGQGFEGQGPRTRTAE